MNSDECARMREMLGDIFWHMETVLYHSDGDMQYHQLSLRAALTEAQEIIQMCPTSAAIPAAAPFAPFAPAPLRHEALALTATLPRHPEAVARPGRGRARGYLPLPDLPECGRARRRFPPQDLPVPRQPRTAPFDQFAQEHVRSEERRVGKECSSICWGLLLSSGMRNMLLHKLIKRGRSGLAWHW